MSNVARHRVPVCAVIATALLGACAPSNTLRAAVDGAWRNVTVRTALISPGGCGTPPPPGTSCPSDTLALSDGNADSSNTHYALGIGLGAGSPGQTLALPHDGIDVHYFDSRLPPPSELTSQPGPNAAPIHGVLRLGASCKRDHVCGSFEIDFAGAHPVSLRGRFDVHEPSAAARQIP